MSKEPEIKNMEESAEIEKQKMINLMKHAKEQLTDRLSQYLEGNPMYRPDGKTNEFEVRFGTNTKSGVPVSKIDYNNVVKQLLATGFYTENPEGYQMLRIQTEYTNKKNETRFSNIRTELVGADIIQEYCKYNSIQKIIDMPSNEIDKIKFTEKSSTLDKDGKFQKPIDFLDMNFRVSYQLEKDYNIYHPFAKSMIDVWSDKKKTFRCLNRVRFSHPIYPVFADVSIVRSSKKVNRYVDLPTYTIAESGVFNSIETYEIELEIDNKRVGPGTLYSTVDSVLDILRKCIRTIMSGLQGSNYPIPFSERDAVIESYMKLLHGKDYTKKRDRYGNELRASGDDFIGPSSVTLQIDNIVPKEEGVNIPNIRDNYTVTDKADGERKLLYINKDGKIYLIDTNLNVIFTGSKTSDKELFHSLLDGEHIKYDKNGEFINTYAAFDIYYINDKSQREKAFFMELEEDVKNNFRYSILSDFVYKLKPSSMITEQQVKWEEYNDKGVQCWKEAFSGKISKTKPYVCHTLGLLIECKTFYYSGNYLSIFDACSKILSKEDDKLFKYNTDGLIFTPANTGVASNSAGTAGPLRKITWDLSFKWKPAEFNTVDFLVSIVKDKNGRDKIQNIFNQGKNITKYKTIQLRCGFDPLRHGFLNPFNDIIHDRLPSPDDNSLELKYKPEPFQPTNPYDPDAGLTNIELKDDGRSLFMVTEETKEYFEESMIVEFRYDIHAKKGWNWIPIRVRYDKTQKLLSGKPEYGNSYPVANSNWRSIHNPVTKEMIQTGEDIPESSESDVYYNNKGSRAESNTESLRNFHNLYVKRKLIIGVSHPNNTLIDYAVGKAGDLAKWRAANLSFVFGIDVSRDNIHNHLNGACARYLGDRRNYTKMPYSLFVVGNSGLNIRNTSAFPGDTNSKDKMIANAVFGKGSKDSTILGKGVYNRYGVGENGFNISSCQFALHYFFKDPTSLHGFMRNLAECTKENGYFIGTCYDGETVFKLLENKELGEGISFITEDNNKICEIIKDYNETGFEGDDTSIGYAINVFQESINKSFREYLVNFNYLIRIMDDYGFTLITKDEAKQMKLPNNTGLFSELFAYMQNEIKQNPKIKTEYKDAINMSSAEKSLSFMNRYFVFKKTVSLDPSKISKILLNAKIKNSFELDEETEVLEKEIESQEKLKPPTKKRIRKLKAKIVLKPKQVDSFITNSKQYQDTEDDEEDEDKEDEDKVLDI